MQIAVDGSEISYEMAGAGPPVVLIHGLGGSKRIWSRLAGELAESHTVVAYDLRGSGGTVEVAPGKELSLTVWSDDLRGLLGALGIQRPALVGHSLGASIALTYSLAWPDDVSALVLMGADPELSRLAPRMEKVVDLISRLGIEQWVAEHWSKNTPFSETSLSRTPEILDEYRAMVLANDPDAYTRTCRAIAQTETLTQRLGDVGQPALVISGSDDDRTLPEAGRELAASLANASYVELAGVGHTVPLEAPHDVAAAVRVFLRSNAPGQAPPSRAS
jgi:pimeloyl-ACP methyl ester carboxylesterase